MDRRDGIYPNTTRSQLLGQRLGKGHVTGFGLRIVHRDRARFKRLNGSGVDDHGTFLQMAQRSFGDPEGGIDVGLKRRVKICRGEIVDRFTVLLASGVIHRDIRAAQFGNGFFHQRVAEGLHANVAGNGDRFTAFGLNQRNDRCRIGLLFRQIANSDICTFTGIGDGYRATYAGITAGNQRFFPASFPDPI